MYNRVFEFIQSVILPVINRLPGGEFERYQKRQAELDEAICNMFVKRFSQAQVGNVIEALSGIHPGTLTVSRVFHTLETVFDS